jgi:hypothetical protein
MITLYAKREMETQGLYKGFKKTILCNEFGETVSIYPASLRQPSKAKKTIIHNCFKYKLIWI